MITHDPVGHFEKRQSSTWQGLADASDQPRHLTVVLVVRDDNMVTIQKDRASEALSEDLCRALASEHEACLSVLRHGAKCFGIRAQETEAAQS